MTRNEFSSLVLKAVELYMGSFEQYDSNPQIKVNPATLAIQLVNGSEMLTDIEYSDEAIEEAAGAQAPEYEDAMDEQARQNPDFYAVKKLIKKDAEGKGVADTDAIAAVVDIYFK
ncbi:MAG: hypothetical protein HDS33_00265 [Bacteroides sp.]|nr:hypothetical protein [Bacteroides sp.]